MDALQPKFLFRSGEEAFVLLPEEFHKIKERIL
jgi:hypothetical protein